MSPPVFQAPAFDRLNQSPEAWARQADDAWQRHRDDFLETCEFWVTAGVDERIGKARLPRGTGQKTGSQAVDRKRGSNTPVDRRYDWAARYLAREPLKEIAAAEGADPSTVGRNARETLRMAGWKAQRKSTKCY